MVGKSEDDDGVQDLLEFAACSRKKITEVELMVGKSKDDEGVQCLLEFAAWDDVSSFRNAIEDKSLEIDGIGVWCCRNLGGEEKEYEERTPLMLASMYGSINILNYIISTGKANVNKVCGKERVSALHCAVSGCSVSIVKVIEILIDASAWPHCLDANGQKPVDLLVQATQFVPDESIKAVELLLLTRNRYQTDYFRMYIHKVKPCSMPDPHDHKDCPFLHSEDNTKRRDPKLYSYTPVYCRKYRDHHCPDREDCLFSHGVLEVGLHPDNYKSELCKNPTSCARKLCFFAHTEGDVRMVGKALEEEYRRDEAEAKTSEWVADDITKGYFATNFFRMYRFKVMRCWRRDPHNPKDCAFVHVGEKGTRRDPKTHGYSAILCSEFYKKRSCHKGVHCELAHGAYEVGLHPSYYKTKLCKFGEDCAVRICFFAHKEEELRRQKR